MSLQAASVNEIPTKSEKKIGLTLFIFLIFGAALAFSISFFDAFTVPKRFFLRTFTALLAFWWIYLRTKYNISMPRSPIVLFAAAYFIISCLSIFTSLNIFLSLAYCIDLLCYLVIFLIVISVFQRKDAEKTAPFLLLLGSVVALYSIVQHLGLDPIPWFQTDLVQNRSIATLGNPDFLSAFMVMIIPLTFAYAYREDAWLGGFPCLALWGLFCFVNLFTYSRAGFLSITAGMLFLIVFLGKDRLFRHWKKSLAVAIILAAALAGIIFMEAAGKTRYSLVDRVKVALTGKDISVRTRFYLWKAGMEIVKKHPILGTGPSTFSMAYLPYRYLEPVNIRHRLAMPESSHSFYLDISVFSGIFALLAFLAMTGTLFYMGIKRFLLKKPGDEDKDKSKAKTAGNLPEKDRLYASAYLAGIFAYLVHHIFSFPTIPDQLLFWIFMGFCCLYFIKAEPDTPYGESGFKPAARLIVLILAAALTMVIIFRNSTTAYANYCYNQGKAYQARMEVLPDYEMQKYAFRLALENYEKAINSHPTVQYYWLGKGKLLEQFSYVNKEQELNRDIVSEAVDSYRRAILLNTLNPYPHADLARLCGRWGINDIAEAQYKEALELDSCNVPIMTDLASLYARTKDNDKAEKIFLKAVELYPEGSWTYGNLGKFYFNMGRYEEARQNLEKAREIEPEVKEYTQYLEKIKEKSPGNAGEKGE